MTRSLSVRDSDSGKKALARRDQADAIMEFGSPTQALIDLPVPATSRFMTLLVASMVATCLVLAGTIPIDRVVTASGKLVSRESTLVVQPLETSIIRAILVREGQQVKAGDLLARLDPTFSGADAGSLATQVDSLQAEVNRLQAEADGKPYVVANPNDAAQNLQMSVWRQRNDERVFKSENYRQKIESLEQQIAGNLTAVGFYRQRLAVAQSVEAMRKDLQGMQVGSKLNTLAAQDNRIDMERNIADSQARAEAGQRDLHALQAERDGEMQDWKSKVSQDLTDQGRKLDDARQQLKKASLRHELVELRAPEDATVLSVGKVSVGSVLQSGDQFITLIPAQAVLEAETYVFGRDSGFVHPGDSVVVKFDTFPFTQYGAADGTVRRISADSFAQRDMMSRIGDPGRVRPDDDSIDTMLYYKAAVSLDDVKLHDLPKDFHLVSGMPITADIKIGKRTALSYLLAKVMPTVTEGMREP